MAGRVRTTALPLLRRGGPDPSDYIEHLALDGRRVFLARRVLRDLAHLERSEHPDETGGLLFGRYFSDGEHACTIVTELVVPQRGEVLGTPTTVTITAQAAERMIARAWQKDPLLTPVGWGHTHPRFEAYFSGTDRAEQRAWREPGSVGLVISGLARAAESYRVFVGPESTPARRVRGHDVSPVSAMVQTPAHRSVRDVRIYRRSPPYILRRAAICRRLRAVLIALSLGMRHRWP
jgi:proteasome lid subunit RPN8/RPN11